MFDALERGPVVATNRFSQLLSFSIETNDIAVDNMDL